MRSLVVFAGQRAAAALDTNRPEAADRVTIRLVAADAAFVRCVVVPAGLTIRDAFALLLILEAIGTA